MPRINVLFLLCHAFAILKLLHILHTSPCFVSPNLNIYDKELKAVTSDVTYVHFGKQDPAWTQASLHVKQGSLGF